MSDDADVGEVDAHSEGDRSDNDVILSGLDEQAQSGQRRAAEARRGDQTSGGSYHEQILDLLAIFRVHAAVVREGA